MTPGAALAVLAAGTAAGLINTVVGSGTLITFPTLIAIGYPPVLANVSNTVGLVLGSVSGAIGYRRELAGQRRRLITLGAAAVAGGLTGGLLLLTLPSKAFDAIVPVLIVAGIVLVLLQPRLQRRARSPHPHHVHRGLWASVYGSSVYGGYFGAAQGVLLIAAMGAFLDESLQRVNAAKNVLAALVNGVAAVLFIAVAHVSWSAAGLIAVGSIVGGQIGAHVGRRLPARALRAVIVVMGIVALIALLA